MDQEIFDWLLLLGRWLHITTAITWIGTSIFFIWLDRTFSANANSKSSGHVGDLWMVHGGGFYHVEKLMMGPTKVPEHLHWFKWESYWTWMSGIFLMVLIFYTGSGTFLLDTSVSGISYIQGVLLGLASVIVSWFAYDLLWESRLAKEKSMIGHALTLIWFAGVSYFLCKTLSGRAAYMHIGSMLGTWMTANVFLRIIPRQVRMVQATQKGEPINQDWAKNAKSRSTHNTYFTLPVIFIMLSNHFPSTYGNKKSWLILLAMSAAGATIREFFVMRLQKPQRAKVFGAAGIVIILAVVIFSRENQSDANANLINAEPSQNLAQGESVPADFLRSLPPINLEGRALIQGIVKFEGPIPKGEKIQMSPDCSREHKSEVFSNEVIVADGKLKNVLVRIVKGLEGRPFTDIPQEAVEIDQRGCVYAPRVVGVRVGQKVEFINSDPTFHNVRSVTKANEEFNVAMPTQNQRLTRIFNKPEIVLQTKCSVHPWMTASLAVMDHPYFSITNDAGVFRLPLLDPGSYEVELWHETLGTQVKELKVSADETLDLEFSFAVPVNH